jgi:hypothetical protein
MKKILFFLTGLFLTCFCYAQSDEWLSYDDGVKANKVNYDYDTPIYDIAIKYTSADIRASGFTTIHAVKVFNEPGPPTKSATVKIWQGTNAATEVFSKEYTPNPGWNEIAIDAAYQVDNLQDLWIGVRYEALAPMHPHACMDKSLDYPGRSNWMRPVKDGAPGAWTDELNQLGDWNIQFLAGGFQQQESEIIIKSSGHVENALFYHNGTIYASDWAKKPGLLHAYTQSGTDLVHTGNVEITGLPEMPNTDNFYGYASDGEMIYAVNQTGYIYVIDPATLSLQKTIKTVYDNNLGGPLTIAYDAGRGGFWCSFKNWSNVVFIQKDGTLTDLTLKGGAKNTMGLAYDDVSEGGPYLWASIGNFPDDNYAKIGRWNLQTGELTEDIKNVPDILDTPTSENYMGSIFLYQDINTGKQVLAGSLMSQSILFAYDMQNTFNPQSPAKVSNFFLIPEASGYKFANLTWKNPEKSIDGNSLSDLSEIRIYRDGQLVHTIADPQAGANGMWMDFVSEEKVYSYKIVAVNSAGEGQTSIRTAFIGLDIPSPVSNLKLENDANAGKLTWTAPSIGKNGGPISSLTYTVVRHPDDVTVADNITETNYTDKSISLLDLYSYTVTVKNVRGESEPVTSNPFPLGTATVPWKDMFNRPEMLEQWTIINANEDYDTWTHNSYSREGSMQCFGQVTDDWMISPAIALESGEKYILSWYHNTNIDNACHYTVSMGKGVTVASQTVELGSYEVTSKEYIRQIMEFTVAESGNYNFGWHAFDPDPQGDSKFISIDDVTLTFFNTIDLSATAISGPDEINTETETEFTVTVKNEGQTAVSGFEVHLVKDADETQTVGVITCTDVLTPGATKDFRFLFTSPVSGDVILRGVVTTADDFNALNDTTAGHFLKIYPKGSVKVPIGDLTSPEYWQLTPFNCFYEGNVAQTIYYGEEIGKPGVINALEYYYSSEPGEIVADKPIKIYMAMTQEDDLYEGWITKDMVLVYDGLLNLPDDRRHVIISLQKPFLYTGENLMIYTIGVDTKSYNQMTQFQCTSREQYRTRVFADRSASFDYTNPGHPLKITANISLLMDDKGASLNGTVTGNDQNPIAGATVELAGQSRMTTTDANGKYEFAFVPETAACEVLVSKPGYGQETQSEVMTDAGLVFNFTLTACEAATVKNLLAELVTPEVGKPKQVSLSWEQPDGNGENTLTGYRIYVNQQRKAELPANVLSYLDVITLAGNYTYEVSALWSSGCESAAISSQIELQPDMIIAQYPFFEGFESGEISAFWEEKHLRSRQDWEVVTEVSDNDNSFTAHGGQYFAVLSDMEHYSTTTRLTTPMFDFSSLPEPYLSFWHLQAVWGFVDRDILSVHYKNTPEGKWKLLAEYDEDVPAWKKEVLQLPEPSATYWIAFEGVSKYGYGVMLDDIKVSDADGVISVPSTKENSVTVKMYPNPVSDYLTVKGEKIEQAEVYNVLGQAVAVVPFNGEQQREIDVRNYSSGIYIVKVTGQNGGSVSRQIIVSHE